MKMIYIWHAIAATAVAVWLGAVAASRRDPIAAAAAIAAPLGCLAGYAVVRAFVEVFRYWAG